MALNPPGQYADDRNLRALAGQPVQAAGCDLSMGMLRSAGRAGRDRP
jgi:hypothetical protein